MKVRLPSFAYSENLKVPEEPKAEPIPDHIPLPELAEQVARCQEANEDKPSAGLEMHEPSEPGSVRAFRHIVRIVEIDPRSFSDIVLA